LGKLGAMGTSQLLIEREELIVNQEDLKESENTFDDAGLVAKAQAGDMLAFRELVEAYQHRVFKMALGMLGNEEDARDVVQDGFLKAYKKLDTFKGQSTFYTWLYRIVMNLSIDLSRKKYRKSEILKGDNYSLDLAVNNLDTGTKLGIKNPEQEVERQELGNKIKIALANLSPAHREVIILREIDGLSYAEMAKVIQCTEGTIMSRLHHARKKLQEELGRYLKAKEGVNESSSGASKKQASVASNLGIRTS